MIGDGAAVALRRASGRFRYRVVEIETHYTGALVEISIAFERLVQTLRVIPRTRSNRRLEICKFHIT